MNELEEIGDEHVQPPCIRPGRPLAFSFEFLEVFSGPSRVTDFVSSFGIICGQPLELSRSEEFNMKFPHLVEWITHLLAERILKAVLLMPPCTTFSIMRRLALRDRHHPYGYDPKHPQTQDGIFWDKDLSRLVGSHCSDREAAHTQDEVHAQLGGPCPFALCLSPQG